MSNTIIELRDDRSGFAPGETVWGTVRWESSRDLKKAELNLLYYTKGRGTQDVRVVQRETWERPDRQGYREFSFELPATGPYSFSGKLLSLVWAIELVLKPGSDTTRVDLVVAPGGEEIDLHRYPPPDDGAESEGGWRNLIRSGSG